MDVYDFDGTLYRGDSTADFVAWCARRYPRVFLTLPHTGIAACAYFGFHAINKTDFKRSLYRFLPLIPDIDKELDRFWAAHERNIDGPCRPKADDVVISASPEFLLRDVCTRRGLKLIASSVDPHTGRVLGPNCSGEEKVKRYRTVFGNAPIGSFYSDSRNDDPLAGLASRAFLVDIPHNLVEPWPLP